MIIAATTLILKQKNSRQTFGFGILAGK